VALKALGNAGEASGPIFRSADPVVKKARDLARSGASPTTKLAKFLVSTKKTGGWDNLVELIYNGTGAVNQFDQYGHFIQSVVTLTNCNEYETSPSSGCHSFFGEGAGASAFDPEAALQRIAEEAAEKSGGTAATSAAPGGYVTPSKPAEPTPELGEGERLGAGASASPPQRALLNYLLGP
jgi:hypothetical protein